MDSKFFYRGAKSRQLTVFKTAKQIRAAARKSESLPYFAFSEEAQSVLGGLFSHHPPGDGDLLEDMFGRCKVNTDSSEQYKDDTFSTPSMRKADISKKLEGYSSRMKTNPQLQQVLPFCTLQAFFVNSIESATFY